ncbi:hypothetical protein [Piscirickettsia salmonis]|nr:hypothetical protein [Piscirickettsia salmonis]
MLSTPWLAAKVLTMIAQINYFYKNDSFLEYMDCNEEYYRFSGRS